MRKIEVTGCSDCPMCDMNDMSSGFNCRMRRHGLEENSIKEDKNYQAITPEWCPIKSDDIVFVMKRDDKE